MVAVETGTSGDQENSGLDVAFVLLKNNFCYLLSDLRKEACSTWPLVLVVSIALRLSDGASLPPHTWMFAVSVGGFG